MSVIADCLGRVSMGEPLRYKNLVLYPIIATTSVDPDYIVLDEALQRGCAKVTEVSESGSVGELRFVNECDNRVLLLDGEELIGAKQNRILNLSILIPAHSSIVIPVSCVEAGRWHHQSHEFSSSGRTHHASGRASKSDDVTYSLMSDGVGRSNQSRVWEDVDNLSARMHSSSPTRASAAMYEQHRGSIDEYVAAFAPVAQQVGALFVINDKPVGLDMFENSAIFSQLFAKLLQSYALDALDQMRDYQESQSKTAESNRDSANMLLQAIAAAKVESYKAVGDGQDLRLKGRHCSGGALEVDGRILHLFGFYFPGEVADDTPGEQVPMTRASIRRSLHNR